VRWNFRGVLFLAQEAASDVNGLKWLDIFLLVICGAVGGLTGGNICVKGCGYIGSERP